MIPKQNTTRMVLRLAVLAIVSAALFGCPKPKTPSNTGVLLSLLQNSQPAACPATNAAPAIGTTVTISNQWSFTIQAPTGATTVTITNSNNVGEYAIVTFYGANCLGIDDGITTSVNSGSSGTFNIPAGTQVVKASVCVTACDPYPTSSTMTATFH